MTRTTLMSSYLIALVACATVAPVPLQSPFDEHSLAYAQGPGTATIEGQAFLKTRGGDVKYGAGEEVILLPVSPYTNEYVQGVGTIRGAATPDARLETYTRRTMAGGDGKFTFRNVPAGEYHVYTRVFWEIPSQYGLRTTGNWVKGRVVARAGETTSIVLTQ